MKEYYLGLDIGTDSIGWAITNPDYSIPKFKGNAMWGIRLLDESNTAEERRCYRTQRRRLQRAKYRQECLEMLFDKEISKIDISFFQRLKESNLYLEDKSIEGKYSVFNDKNYTDKDYHTEYPTVYHLRKDLINNSNPHDVRLVYLAVSHIIKHRGHFLFDSENLGENGSPNFNDIWNELCEYVEYITDSAVDLSIDNYTDLQIILKSKMSITRKKEQLKNFFACTKEETLKSSILDLLSGASVDLSKMFDDESLKEAEEKKITFSSNFDDKVDMYEAVLGDEKFELVCRIKAIYDWAILADVLNNYSYISEAKCYVYDKHKSDLELLKEFVKDYCPKQKNKIFNDNGKDLCNYPAYSGHASKGVIDKKCGQNEFCEFLKKILPKECPNTKYENMYSEIASGVFMPKAVSKDNSVIPMQIQKAELEAILRNAKEYLPFLSISDENSKTVEQKIIDIFSFRIPYYVGPLNKHSDKAWLERKDVKIYPWNFYDVVDMDKSAERFIENLTSKCSYLHKEDVLPKNSITYSRFVTLNELNNLKIDNKGISVELKQNIFNDLFLKKNKVTQKVLRSYLKSVYANDFEISGIDGDFKSTMKPYLDLKPYNLTDEEKEEIIKAITIFGDDKTLLKKRLKSKYSSKLSVEDIKKISKLKYTGWGKLSNKLLSGLYVSDINSGTGEAVNIISVMWNTNNNFMQALHNYNFVEVISKENGNEEFTSLKKEIDAMYISPKVKRPIYQTMKIIEELVKIQKSEPKKIFVEVARGPEEKKRTVSRKAKLIELYKSCKKDNLELYNQLKDTDETEFRRDALYLYYTQFGKCMYSGQEIDISEIYNRNIYDIDHIFPQSKIKDDSLDNRVLVVKKINGEKDNVYPISQEIRSSMASFWKMLKNKGLISQKKYERLIRNTPLTDGELNSFINRQLVETRQSTKAIGELLQKRYPNSKIVYVKAKLISEFRQKNDMIKCREINDLHHAKDAYLNVVVGNVYYTKFTSKYFIRDLQTGSVSLNKMYNYNVDGAWIADNNESMNVVKSTMKKNNIRFTRYATKQHGGLFDQNLVKKGNGQVSIKKNSPVSDIEKYGGYNRAKSAYFAFVEYTNKNGKTIRSFEPIDLYIEHEYKSNPEQFIAKKLNVKEVKIIIPCVKFNTLVEVDGFRMHISSKNSGGADLVCKPAIQLVLDYNNEWYVKQIVNYLSKCKEFNEEKDITEHDHISSVKNIELYNIITDKLLNTIYSVKFSKLAKDLVSNEKRFENLSVYSQCIVIIQLLNILHANVVKGDLSLIGKSKKGGTLTIANKIQPKVKSFNIVNQSITGLYEQKVDLLR